MCCVCVCCVGVSGRVVEYSRVSSLAHAGHMEPFPTHGTHASSIPLACCGFTGCACDEVVGLLDDTNQS